MYEQGFFMSNIIFLSKLFALIKVSLLLQLLQKLR